MEVKISVQNASRELVIESVLSPEELEAELAKALSGESGLLSLADAKGRRVIVPGAKIAFIELGSPSVGQVGFRS